MTTELRYKRKNYRLTKRYRHIIKNLRAGKRVKYEYKLVTR